MKKLVAVVLVAGALFWAKKRWFDAPAAPVQSKTEAAAEKLGGAIARAKAAQSTSGSGDRSLASLLGSLVHRDNASSAEAKAKARVETFMASWKEGGTSLNDAAQAAACLWSRGARFIPDQNEIRDAADGFDRWRRDHDLYTDIASYRVGDVISRGNEPGRGDYTVIEVTINGKPHRIGVPDKANPLFWAE